MRFDLRPNTRFFVAALALVCSGLLGCGAEEPKTPALDLDLVARFDSAQVLQPTLLVDLGQPESRRHLVSGWDDAVREIANGQRRATWSLDDGAEIDLFVARPADRELVFRIAPLQGGRQNLEPVEHLSVELNGEPLADLELEAGWKSYRVTWPATAQQLGWNRLSVAHPRSEPQGVGQRRLLWDTVRVEPRPRVVPPAPVVRAERSTIFLPFDTRLDYFLELPAHSEVVIEQLRSRGDATGRLAIEWRPHEGPPVVIEDLSATPEFRVAVTQSEPASGRLSFKALAAGDAAERAAGMVLTAPRVVGGLAEAPEPAAAPASARTVVDGPQPNILVYLIDTLRADHLGCYGYHRPTSPHIDKLASEGVVFENSQAQSPWTRASVASVLTGLWPQVHGTNGDDDALSEDAVTLAEALKSLGYRTAAVTGNGNAARIAGFAQGFDHFKYLRNLRPNDPLATSADINQAVFDWLDQNGDGEPFFLWVHTIDPHAPYDPPEPYASQFAADVDPELGSIETILDLNRRSDVDPEMVADLIDLYDAEIAENDAEFGALLAELDRRGFYDDLVVVVLSDHGEEFYDHGGWTHGKTLYTEMLDTPLVMRFPGGRVGERETRIVDHVDLMPTLVDIAGGEPPTGIQGASFLPLLLDGGEVPWNDHSVAHLDLRGRKGTSLLDPNWKLIQYVDGDHEAFPQLYDRRQDREETLNMAPERPELARFLAALRKEEEERAGTGLGPAVVDPERQAEIEAELRALGYLQ